MFEIGKTAHTPDNFFAGTFPIVTDVGIIKPGADIKKHAPLSKGENGIEEAAADTLDKLVGIAADVPSEGEVVYYLTGEYFANALVLPKGVTLEALKPALRQLEIFLK
ncbi:hypothetical protein EDD70_1068 [Hydrogenoanaerobacterium saccharovorans]|uniref:Bacteriophage lambda head decoration protein D n=1 Tax=Hydrogenoanaerobacterium saccharovorans TaxID=474960 RepID=A0A1H8A247_9FIRM|nr:hypothetical protein [Hydrogenoanaerobacterium saccharovorans]RPF48253.1 hypothetical protein EDD70_1068 [Hydrogenoanaerobacterium saccharovorans]SEM63994.1 hypothetical protein SAMN05216180_1023 [Hydrogenoanaerobacterium saccharovorans]